MKPNESFITINDNLKNVEKFIEDNKGILYPEAYEVLYNEFVIEIRGFGQFFARACLGENFQNVD